MDKKNSDLVKILHKYKSDYHSVLPSTLRGKQHFVLDLSRSNQKLESINLNNEKSFSDFVFNSIYKADAAYGIGKYNEDRYIYRLSNVFTDSTDYRSIHLGLDLWYDAKLPVHVPLNGTVHSFKNNDEHGNYGPTIILEHELDGLSFFTLYGHLSRESLNGLEVGQPFSAGDVLAQLGTYAENVHWPPHLHFQIIENLQGNFGDYPGVCSKEEKEFYLKNCPDPNLILGLL